MKRLFLVSILTLLTLSLMAANQQGNVTTAYDVATPSAPTTALPAVITPVFTDGTHYVKFAYVTDNGIGTLSAAGTVRTTDPTHTAVRVSVVASTNPAVKSVNIYATKAGAAVGGQYYLVATGVANSTADVDVGALDAALTVAAPTSNTSQVDTVISCGTGRYFYRIQLINLDNSLPVYVTFDGTLCNTTTSFFIPAGYGPANPFIWTDPVGGPSGVNSIHLHTTSAGASVTYLTSEQ